MEAPIYQGSSKVSLDEPLVKDGYIFPPLNNSVLVEAVGEVQAFQQLNGNTVPRVYQRNYLNHDPLMSSIPPNNFSTPPNPNASNVPSPLRDSPEYRQAIALQSEQVQPSAQPAERRTR